MIMQISNLDLLKGWVILHWTLRTHIPNVLKFLKEVKMSSISNSITNSKLIHIHFLFHNCKIIIYWVIKMPFIWVNLLHKIIICLNTLISEYFFWFEIWIMKVEICHQANSSKHQHSYWNLLWSYFWNVLQELSHIAEPKRHYLILMIILEI